jgi:uncharacterized membrane protein YoaK (UPF0700 family)
VTRYDRRAKMLAAALSALAGFVDATGFIALGGFFVSFMSGNTTRLAVGIAQDARSAATAASLLGTFLLGVILGTLTGHLARTNRAVWVLIVVTGLLAAAASFGMAQYQLAAVVAMTLAMGAENAVFEREGEVHIGLTYMTGTLVKLGQRLTIALLGGDKWAWRPYLMLWMGLASGAVAGALIYSHLGLGGLWLASAMAAVCAFAARYIRLN